MKKWFGKGCKYLCAQWEDNEITGGPDYKDSEPVLVFCKHPKNISDVEGNCNQTECPLKKDTEDDSTLGEFPDNWAEEDFKYYERH